MKEGGIGSFIQTFPTNNLYNYLINQEEVFNFDGS
jgi:hypothetical protein